MCIRPVSGDSRVNENPMLTMYHTLFVREHNRIAKKLRVGVSCRYSIRLSSVPGGTCSIRLSPGSGYMRILLMTMDRCCGTGALTK